jgi:hypothetical protein
MGDQKRTVIRLFLYQNFITDMANAAPTFGESLQGEFEEMKLFRLAMLSTLLSMEFLTELRHLLHLMSTQIFWQRGPICIESCFPKQDIDVDREIHYTYL